MNDIKVIAFGGDTVTYPPNTSKAIDQALANNVDGIFVDVCYTKDEEIICYGGDAHGLLHWTDILEDYTFSDIVGYVLAKLVRPVHPR